MIHNGSPEDIQEKREWRDHFKRLAREERDKRNWGPMYSWSSLAARWTLLKIGAEEIAQQERELREYTEKDS